MKEKELTIDQTFEQIEEVINNLEADDISLEKSFELYNKGMKLIKECNDKIDTVEKQILIIESENQE